MIKIKRLTYEQKNQNNAGSFYAMALGIGILVSTISNLVMTCISANQPNNSNTAYGFRKTTVMRLSPVPSRSSISIIG